MPTRSFLVAVAALALAGSSIAANPFAPKSQKQSQSSKSDERCERTIQDFVAQSDSIMPLGIVVANIHDFSSENANYLRASRKMTDRLQIVSITQNSLADKIGLKVGDVIMEFNGIYVPKGPDAATQLVERVLPQIDWTKPLQATVLRNGFAQLITAPDNTGFASSMDGQESNVR